MTDAEKLVQYTTALATHIEKGEQLMRAARDQLNKTQNESTHDGSMNPKLWTTCRDLIWSCARAIDHSRNLLWDQKN
jgi:hypothetical protein